MTREQREQQIWNEACHRYADSKMRNAFVAAAKWADSHPQWIPVEERKPEVEDLYIVSNGKATSVAYWVDDDWDSFGDVITHWMPLPVPPQGKEE